MADGYVWFRTDTNQELRDAIDFSFEYISKLPNDLTAFRWSVIGSVLALQAACVFQLHGHDTTGTSVLGKQSRKKVMLHLHGDWKEAGPTQRLATPTELLKRVRKVGETPHDFQNLWDDTDQENCEYLVTLRNEFIHFIPQGWNHALNGYPAQLKSCWTIISTLVSKPISYGHRIPSDILNEVQRKAIIIIEQIERLENEL